MITAVLPQGFILFDKRTMPPGSGSIILPYCRQCIHRDDCPDKVEFENGRPPSEPDNFKYVIKTNPGAEPKYLCCRYAYDTSRLR